MKGPWSNFFYDFILISIYIKTSFSNFYLSWLFYWIRAPWFLHKARQNNWIHSTYILWICHLSPVVMINLTRLKFYLTDNLAINITICDWPFYLTYNSENVSLFKFKLLKSLLNLYLKSIWNNVSGLSPSPHWYPVLSSKVSQWGAL